MDISYIRNGRFDESQDRHNGIRHVDSRLYSYASCTILLQRALVSVPNAEPVGRALFDSRLWVPECMVRREFANIILTWTLHETGT